MSQSVLETVSCRNQIHRMINQEVEPLTGSDNMQVLIADDTLYRRIWSKHIEVLSRIFDHTYHRNYRWFWMLTLGWSDGINFLPVFGHGRDRGKRQGVSPPGKDRICPGQAHEEMAGPAVH